MQTTYRVTYTHWDERASYSAYTSEALALEGIMRRVNSKHGIAHALLECCQCDFSSWQCDSTLWSREYASNGKVQS